MNEHKSSKVHAIATHVILNQYVDHRHLHSLAKHERDILMTGIIDCY